jgi:hypothetical protein
MVVPFETFTARSLASTPWPFGSTLAVSVVTTTGMQRSPMHGNGSSVQVAEQPSPDVRLPSSHSSVGPTM